MQNVKTEDDFEESSDNPNKEWEVEKILKDRTKRRKNRTTGKMEPIKEYLIKWVGFKTPTWEPEENLENSQELLKDFLLNQIIKKCKKVKTKKKAINTINTSKIYKYEISPNVTEYRINSNGVKEEEDQSTFTNSLNNQELSNKNVKTNKKNVSSILSLEDEENAIYDIEIDGDEKKEGNDIKKEQESIKVNTGLESKYLKIVKNEEITVNNNEKRNDNIAKIALDDDSHNKKNNTINNINKIVPEKEDLIDSEKKSYSIYLEEDKDECENLDKIIKDKSETESSKRFLAKKRKKDVFINCDKIAKKDNSIKVLEIYSMKVPGDNDKEGKGIKLNIKFRKNNKIYIEEFYTKSGEIPSDYLAKYFEMFICDSFKGEKYSKGMSFD
jgi:hypothetical protein